MTKTSTISELIFNSTPILIHLVYLKGKPKYVTVYEPKPQKPIVKPTTVYHMPVYSP